MEYSKETTSKYSINVYACVRCVHACMCVRIFYAPNKPKYPITILMNNKALDEVKFITYLGVTLDAQLSFKYHIDELTKKISRGIGLLYKLQPFVTTKILTNVYYAIIYPFFTVWGSASKNLLTPILVLQKKLCD